MRIQMQNVNFSYRGGQQILHDIKLDLDGPGLYCIIGPNGVGKSTMIKCMNKLLTPDSGTVLVNGKDTKDMTAKQIADMIGYVPVNTTDVFSMTVFETILIGRGEKSRFRTSGDDVVKVHQIMRALEIEHLSDRKFNDLSAGQHQKVAIARGLVQEKEILILDEPTSNLDVKHQIFVAELLREISRRSGVMIIMISHNLNITAKYADKLILMEEPGRIRCIDDVNSVITVENMKSVYEVDCEILMHEGRPAILFNQLD